MDAPTCAVCNSSLVCEREKPQKIMCPLHVAAPELLAACKEALYRLTWEAHTFHPGQLPREYGIIEAAIFKAEGKG